MNPTLPRSPGRLRRLSALTVVFGGALLGLLPSAHAQTAPTAGTSIGNRASATYTDGAGISRETQSNQVTTTVQQVPAVSLTAPRNFLRNPGSPVYFPHTVQNTGNGPDRFNLATSAITGNLIGGADTVIYADANRDGVPDSQTPVAQTPTLAPGETYSFVVGDALAASATGSGGLTITATSVTSPSPASSNTDSVTVTNGAVVSLRKSVSASAGAPGSGPYTYSLRYTNSGTADSGRVTVTDLLPEGITYVANSASFNRAPGVTPTDTDTDGTQGTGANGINYSAVTANGRTTVTFVVPAVPAGQEGLVSFNFRVAAGAAPGIASNTAQLRYDDNNDDPNGNGTGANNTTPDKADSSNTVDFRINRNVGVTFVGPAAVASAPQGGTVSFPNTLTNTGTGTDSFNITVSNPTTGGFPAGTSFQLFKSDGQSPLLDTNGDQIPDTGPVIANGTYVVVLKATLPPGGTGGPFSVNKVATSVADPTVNATATDTLTAITAAKVNIDNDLDGTVVRDDEVLANPPVFNASGNPGATVTIPLRVTNGGGRADSFVLSVSSAANTQGAPGSTTALPAGYSVSFRDVLTGAISSNINNLPAGATRSLEALVTIPAGAPAGAVSDLYFTVNSPTTGAANTIRDSVTVNAVRAISVQPSLTGQVFPGSAVSYVNVVKNNGNQTETGIAIALSGDANGFSSVVYLDANNNGILDTDETTPITQIATLAAGASQNLIVRVFGPNNTSQVGQTNVTTVKATLSGTPAISASATDTTTLVVGDVSLVKTQAVAPRATPRTAPDTYGAFGTASQSAQNAKPGDRVRYSISVTNTGATPVDNVIVYDALPAYTSFVAGSGRINGTAPTPAITTTNGSLSFSVGTLQPGASATVSFDVQIDG